MIVDDHARFRALARAPQAADCEVVPEAADGEEALAAANRLLLEAVLIDVQLPDTDSLALSRALAERDSSLRIILTSTDPTLVPADALAPSAALALRAKD
jgi:DNA-binding NarL/FixJ family response regulator